MLGLLLNMSGPPTRGDVEDLLLSWVIMNRDEFHNEDEDSCPAPKLVGDLLARVYINSFYSEKRDGPLLEGEVLFATVFEAWKKAFRPRMEREIKKRTTARKFDEIWDDTDLSENACLWWLESISLESATLPRRQARKIGEALGGLAASAQVQMWEYSERMDMEGATT